MAKQIMRHVIDDIDGSDITGGGGERVEFSLRGIIYQIDLSNSNIAKLEAAFQPFVEAANRANADRTADSVSARQPGRRTSRDQAAAVRAWARHNGFDVPDRGRIPESIHLAFEAAH